MCIALRALLVAALASQACVDAASVAANPVRKVIQLMQDMKAEIATEQEKEKELYDKFKCICSSSDDELSGISEAANTKIGETSAKVEEETSEKGQLEQELTGHRADKAAAENDLKQATELRSKEAAESKDSIADTKFNLAALGRAIPSIEGGGGPDALLQAADGTNRLKLLIESSNYLSAFDRREVLAFLGEGDGSDPAIGQVTGILKQMKDDMEENLKSAIETEKRAEEGYKQLKAAKDKEIEVSSEAIEAKEKRSGDLAVSITQNKDSLEDAQTEKSDADEYLASLREQCPTKEKEWKAMIQMRIDEQSALSQAIAILNDDESLDVFKKAVPAALVQDKGRTDAVSGFLQSKAGSAKLSQAQSIISNLMSQKHWSSQSLRVLLSVLQSKFRAVKRASVQRAGAKQVQPPDFGEVVKMIDEMTAVLDGEQDDDTKKKDFCLTQLDKVEGEAKSKQEKLDTITSTIDEVSDEISSFDEDVKDLQDSIKQLDKSVAEATLQRKKEHAEYVDSLRMSAAAKELLGKAKDRLEKFYKSKQAAPAASSLTQEQKVTSDPPSDKLEQRVIASLAFIQQHSRRSRVDPVAVPDLPKAEKKNGGGVVALIDQLIHDTEMEAQAAAHQEKYAQQEYVKIMAESQESRMSFTKSLTDKRNSRATLGSKLTDAKESQKMTVDELQNTNEFLQELHSDCDFLVDNYEIRQEARATEIEALKNAKSVMLGAKY